MPKLFGGLVFNLASTASGAVASTTQKNNRADAFTVTHISAVVNNGANITSQWTIQILDQSTAIEMFSAPVGLSALMGAFVQSGDAAASLQVAPTEPWQLPVPYTVPPGAQFQLTGTNNSSVSAPLQLVLLGYYGN